MGQRAKRIALTVGMALAALNIWTGSPLLALWVGSQVQGGGAPTMEAVAVVVVVMAAVSLALVALLARLGRAHDRLVGFVPTVRDHAPWLRSMRGERPLYEGETPRLSALERILIAMVVIVFVALEVWFFFFAGSPIDQRSGRSGAACPIYLC
jgi:hypothetical protein